MVFSTNYNKKLKQQQLLDVQEAFNLWDLVTSKYHEVERLKMFYNFTHDFDLKAVIRFYTNQLQDNINILTKLMKRFGVKGPTPNRDFGTYTSNPEVVLDEFIAKDIFLYIQEHIEDMLRVVRTSNTNDFIRRVLTKMAYVTIENETKIVKYLKLKGWMEVPPLYPNTAIQVTEKISTTEVYHMWDHLSFRYDNIEQTRIFDAFAFDGDFKLILKKGLKELDQQAKMLEKELKYFGVGLPQKSTDIVVPPNNTEVLTDRYMYRTVLIGLQGALIVHAQSLKQCVFNDRINNIFNKLLKAELAMLNQYIKFGKIKGWLHPVPAYRL